MKSSLSVILEHLSNDCCKTNSKLILLLSPITTGTNRIPSNYMQLGKIVHTTEASIIIAFGFASNWLKNLGKISSQSLSVAMAIT